MIRFTSRIGFCAERHAIENKILKETEKAKIKTILVASPVPRSQDLPLLWQVPNFH